MNKLLVVAALAGTSCTTMVKLDPQAVQRVDITLADGATTICAPGLPSQLRAVVTYANGEAYETWAFDAQGQPVKSHKVPFHELTWSASGGTVAAQGLYQPPDGLEQLELDHVTISANVKGSKVVGTATFGLKFDCGPVVAYRGTPGTPGSNGADGLGGISGGPGEDGGRGGNGQDGGPGGDGGPGPAVEVTLGLVNSTMHGMLGLARVSAQGTVHYLIYDLKGKRMAVSSRGGVGGPGGSGGMGGAGGQGGAATSASFNDMNQSGRTDGQNGQSGSPGNRGADGKGGHGGSLTIRYDAAHPELMKMLVTDVSGGKGGRVGVGGPEPQVAAAPAAELFAPEIARGIPVVVGP